MIHLSRAGIARCQSCGHMLAVRSVRGMYYKKDNPLEQLDTIALCCSTPDYYFKDRLFDERGKKS